MIPTLNIVIFDKGEINRHLIAFPDLPMEEYCSASPEFPAKWNILNMWGDPDKTAIHIWTTVKLSEEEAERAKHAKRIST